MPRCPPPVAEETSSRGNQPALPAWRARAERLSVPSRPRATTGRRLVLHLVHFLCLLALLSMHSGVDNTHTVLSVAPKAVLCADARMLRAEVHLSGLGCHEHLGVERLGEDHLACVPM